MLKSLSSILRSLALARSFRAQAGVGHQFQEWSSSAPPSPVSSPSTSFTPFVPTDDEWFITPPLTRESAGDLPTAPTAYKFLKTRGPDLTISYINKLFDKGLVRLWPAGGSVKRVNKNRALQLGDRILLPRWAVQGFQERKEQRDTERASRIRSDEIERIKRSILYEDADFLAIDKPAGISCHRGKRQRFGLDDLVIGALSDRDLGVTPKLVHRLDKDVSGVLLFAKNGTAASQLTNALKLKSRGALYGHTDPASSGDSGESTGAGAAASEGPGRPSPGLIRELSASELLSVGRPSTGAPPTQAPLRVYDDPVVGIRKVYAAFVRPVPPAQCPSVLGAALRPMPDGAPDLVLSLPTTNAFYFSNQRALEDAVRQGAHSALDLLAASSRHASSRSEDAAPSFRAALTRARVVDVPLKDGGRALRDRPALVLVLLEPLTGRKHQLRQHCAYVLGAPVLGDFRYPLSARLAKGKCQDGEDEEEEEETSDHLLLHSFGVSVSFSSGRRLDIFSPLPSHFKEVLMDGGKEDVVLAAAQQFLLAAT